MTHRRSWRLRVAVLGSLAAGGSGGCSTASHQTVAPDAAPGPPDAPVVVTPPTLVGIALAPAPLVLGVGDKRALTVTGAYDDGSHAIVATGVTWGSSAPAVATIGDDGTVTAIAPGTATITAHDGGFDATCDVAVVLRVFGDDYGHNVAYAPFGGSANGPSLDASGPHSGTAALMIQVPAAGYTGGALVSNAPVDLSGFALVSFWARASKPASLNVVGLGNDAQSAALGAEWNGIAVSTTWQRYQVPIPVPSKLSATRGLFHFAEGPEEGVYTLWLDDIQYEAAPAGLISAPSPAIATETIHKIIGDTFMINGTSVTYQVGGTQETLATAHRYFTFKSSMPSVATIDADGLVTAKANGTTTITATLGAVDAIGALTFVVGS
jgi:Bacterial Ig-like domain (group 2)